MESNGHKANGHATLVQDPDQSRHSSANGHGHGQVGLPEGGGDADATNAERTAMALKTRKRTKTGCLTCRRRRIKCGEERPTCKNCTKSKRECEGYVPRVVFKDPVNAFRHHLDSFDEHHLYNQYDPHGPSFGNIISMTADGVPLAPLAPRPSQYDGYEVPHPIRIDDQYAPASANDYTGQAGNNQFNTGMFGMSTLPTPPMPTTNGHGPASIHAVDRKASVPGPSPISPHNAWPTQFGGDPPITPSHSNPSTTWSYDTASSISQTTPFPTPHTANSNDGTFPSPPWSLPGHANHTTTQMAPPSASNGQERHSVSGDLCQPYFGHQVQLQQQHHGQPPATAVQQVLQEPEDDWFDVDSEEETANLGHVGEDQAKDLGLMIQMSAHRNDADARSMANFLDVPNILTTYQPAYAASPLTDSHTARVFCHFITTTGPSLNVCERHPANPSVIFSGRPVPQAQRALWSYTMPMLALKHQGLLHSMLALSSLHISKLQHASPTPSLKHYHHALRRVARALGNPVKRHDVATLAATLLLGFYEVTTAEHNKWNSHLSGARELVVEIDFARMGRRIEAHRARQEEEEDARYRSYDYDGCTSTFSKSSHHDLSAKAARRLDECLISTLTGFNTRYNDYGQVVDETANTPATEEPLQPRDIENYQVQCDLFWWYAKQDVYQSILSNNRLLLSYDRWGQCPPRAPIGRQDAAYGTMDHLLLLMGRLADFAAKDLPRKRRAGIAAAKAQAQAQAHPHAQPSGPGPSPTQPNGHSPPPFYGMMPDPGRVRLPQGFDQTQHDRMYFAPAPSENKELATATAEAEIEHAAIGAAFDTYAEALGPSFAPLSSEHMTPMATPFGPAIYYRSYPIACIQALFQCGQMIRIRTAPSMPPAAMAAAGMAAQATAPYANTIGRICAGIQPISTTVPLNPHHGAALMDICMPLFHAGVQYQDPAQRGWTITKLRDVARLTGWQTSALIASGCERAWMRAAEMGRGPPYERTMNGSAKDDRVAGRSRDPRFLASAPRNNNDRRFVRQNAGTRVYWAMGILSVEEDMAEMSLGEGELG